MNARTPIAAVTLDGSFRPAIMVGMAPKIDPDKYVTIGTAAKLANVSRFWMRRLVKEQHIAGIEIDGQYFALLSAVEAYAKTVPPSGRPRGGSHAH